MTVSNSKATLTPAGGAQVTGDIKNNEDKELGANIQAIFYDKANNVLGTAKGAANDIAAGQTKPFTLTTDQKVGNYYRMVVEVNSIF
jgi:hypothetical protein